MQIFSHGQIYLLLEGHHVFKYCNEQIIFFLNIHFVILYSERVFCEVTIHNIYFNLC